MSVSPICVYCLVQEDSRLPIVAKYTDAEGLQYQVACEVQTHPPSFRSWIWQHMELDAMFITGNTVDSIQAIATYHGDPVCSPHLYELVTNERKGLRYGRK